MRTLALVVSVLVIAGSAAAQSSGIRTWCNPIDLNYQYNFEQINEKISYRSAADPVIVNHKGEYYLFATISGGWWHSTDLIHWDFITPKTIWPVEDICAPAARSYGDAIYLFQSNFEQRPIFIATDPKSGVLEYFNRWMPLMPEAKGPWDPDIFRDPDTGRWFMYFGSSDTFPIYGIELDFANRLTYIGKPKELLFLHPDAHGWERFGRDHRDPRKPYIEGAWMTKYNGKYYLQYAAPGTEYNVYANGTYVGDDPLGPFTYAPYNPVSYKPGGFVQGAGHGNTFQDNYGNFWNTGTPWIGFNWTFERRMAMFPAGFDSDGVMYANTRFGDFPHYAPASRWTNRNDLFTGWMLLSYRRPATSSSNVAEFPVSNVTDENPRTFWLATANKPGEWITIDLQKVFDVKAVQVNYADYKSNIYRSDASVYTQFKMFASADGNRWDLIADLTGEKRDRANAYIELAHPLRARYVRYEHVYAGSLSLAISDIRIFGNGSGKAPRTPRKLSVRRDVDARSAFVQWEPAPHAVGYNVLWGVAKDKLYQTYQVFADEANPIEVRALNIGQEYWFAIEAFDENGVSKVSEPVQAQSESKRSDEGADARRREEPAGEA